MTNQRLLLVSNSTNYGEEYLAHPLSAFKSFLGDKVKRVVFFPFAGVSWSYDEYAAKVRGRFGEIGYELESLHEARDPFRAIERAEAIAIGGGNTFHLLRALYEANLLEATARRVRDGVPFIGWSAGANVACPTIKTTNDMPIVEPPSLSALNLIPFQINPHYTDEQLANHRGETREERLLEFIKVNDGVWVVGLREGSMLKIEGAEIALLGQKEARVFIKGRAPLDYGPQDSLQFLLDGKQP